MPLLHTVDAVFPASFALCVAETRTKHISWLVLLFKPTQQKGFHCQDSFSVHTRYSPLRGSLGAIIALLLTVASFVLIVFDLSLPLSVRCRCVAARCSGSWWDEGVNDSRGRGCLLPKNKKIIIKKKNTKGRDRWMGERLGEREGVPKILCIGAGVRRLRAKLICSECVCLEHRVWPVLISGVAYTHACRGQTVAAGSCRHQHFIYYLLFHRVQYIRIGTVGGRRSNRKIKQNCVVRIVRRSSRQKKKVVRIVAGYRTIKQGTGVVIITLD